MTYGHELNEYLTNLDTDGDAYELHIVTASGDTYRGSVICHSPTMITIECGNGVCPNFNTAFIATAVPEFV